jgi:PAS domain S-box-containing protein
MSVSQNARVLVVDDDEAGRYATTRLLRHSGYEVLEASFGLDCLRIVEESLPDVVLLDVRLPDLSGIDVCRQLKSSPRTAGIPVIQTSAFFTSTENRIEGLESGADAYLSSPCEPRELLAQLQALLRLRQLQADILDSEERLRLAHEAGGIGAFDWDIPKQAARCSHEYFRVMGAFPRESGKITYEEWRSWVHPDDLPRAERELELALAKGESVRGQYRVCSERGGMRWINYSGKISRDAAQRPVRMIGTVLDVTERKQAEEALKRSEEQMRLITDATPALVSYIDRTQRYRFINKQYEQWFGHKREEILGRSMTDVLGEEAMARLAPHVAKALQGEDVRFEVEAPYREGGTRWIDAHYVPDRDSSGEVAGFFVLVLDVTARMRAEEALRQSELKYRNLFENMAEEVHFWEVVRDSDGQIKTCRLVDANPPSLRTWGRTSIEEIKGRTTEEIFGPGATEHYLPVVRKIMAERAPYSWEDHFPPLNKHFRFTSVPLGEHFITTGADITQIKLTEQALRESEEKFRSAYAHAAIGFSMTTPDGQVLDANPAYCALTGYSVEELRTLHFSRLIHPDDFEENARLVQELLAGKIPGFVTENRYVRNGGGVVWVRKSGSLVRNEKGAPKWLIVLVEDITERKNTDEALRQTQEQLRRHADGLEKKVEERTSKLQEALRELEQYSYSISHDMRAPLRAMNQYSQLVLEEFGPKLGNHGQMYLSRIANAAVRLDRLITDVLSYHRITHGELTLESVDLEALARDIVQQYPMFHDCNAEIDFLGPLAPVRANLAALTQCLSNLLGNAVKFVAPSVQPKVRVWTQTRGPFVRVWIEDNGIGIDPTHLDRIWGIFHQLNDSKTYGGTGIGLSIVKKAVERMGGQVGVESEPGKGSRFWFELPAFEGSIGHAAKAINS